MEGDEEEETVLVPASYPRVNTWVQWLLGGAALLCLVWAIVMTILYANASGRTEDRDPLLESDIVCCSAQTAGCLSCVERVEPKVYCGRYPHTVGCE